MPEQITGIRLRDRYHWFYAGSGMWVMVVMGILFIATDRILTGSIMIIGALIILLLLIIKQEARDRPTTPLEITLALCSLFLLPILVGFQLLLMPFNPLAIAFFAVLLILEGLALYEIWRAWRRSKNAPGE